MPYYPPPASSGTGDVTGPSSATDTAIPVFDGTTGKLIKNTTTTITLAGALVSGGGEFTTLPGSNVVLQGGSATATNGNGGNTYVYGGAKNGTGTDGSVYLGYPGEVFIQQLGSATINAKLDVSSLSAARIFTFPDATTTVAGTDATQPLTNKDLTSGTNTFPTFNQNTTGSAATLTTGRTVQTNLASTSAATFNGSANITPGITGTLPVSHGGTGATTLTGYVKGNGTSAMTAVSTATAAADILAVAYPVGAIYISTLSTNPATLLGFGTWVAYATGQVLVGKASTGTFSTAGATGGEETHTLTTAEMPSHTHAEQYPNGSAGSNYFGGMTNAINSYTSSIGGVNVSTASAGGGGAHNNLQPYIVVYMWNRTA